ncbi:hypothetical protein [Burkholderia lata]|uniref:hypothetical protein n=1 Tax=Burkholderia lata (strain ATCC 17760 / DSM 23089 / LMG 22485 / NCIMB 9086 / R18194 / 383) TaxID=482957 RepID=UPI000A43DD83|nr:hypothetical protein [Burkholderia lata]
MRRLGEFRRARIVAEGEMADLHHPQPDARFAVAQDSNSKKRSVCLRLAAYIAVMNLTHGM